MRVETPNARFPFPALDGAKCAKVQQLKVQSTGMVHFFCSWKIKLNLFLTNVDRLNWSFGFVGYPFTTEAAQP